MKPNFHIFLGLLFSLFILILFPKIGLGFFIIFLSTILIDIDHYLYFVYRKKDWNLKKAYNWFLNLHEKYISLPKSKRKQFYGSICWLHGIETFILLAILGLFSPIFLFILTGFTFHLLVDDIYDLIKRNPGHNFSSIYIFIKSKKLKHIDESK